MVACKRRFRHNHRDVQEKQADIKRPLGIRNQSEALLIEHGFLELLVRSTAHTASGSMTSSHGLMGVRRRQSVGLTLREYTNGSTVSGMGKQSSPGAKAPTGSGESSTESQKDVLQGMGHPKGAESRVKRRRTEHIISAPSYTRRHRHNASFSSLVRGLKRLVSLLERKHSGYGQKFVLDAIDKSIIRLKKRLKRAEKEALTTGFYGQPPQVSIR